MVVSKEAFYRWKNDPVTAAIFNALEEMRETLNDRLTDASIIMHEDHQKISIHTLGQRDGIDLLLQIDLEDISEEEDET